MPLIGNGVEAAQTIEDVSHSREQYGNEACYRAEKKGRRDDMRENLGKVINRCRFDRHRGGQARLIWSPARPLCENFPPIMGRPPVR